MGIYRMTSVSLTDWDWDAFGTRRIYGRFDAAFLLNYSRAGNNEIAWESGPMLWTSPGVNSPWLNPLHSILHPQPRSSSSSPQSSERRSEEEEEEENENNPMKGNNLHHLPNI